MGRCLNCENETDRPFCCLDCAIERYAILSQLLDLVDGQVAALAADIKRLVAML